MTKKEKKRLNNFLKSSRMQKYADLITMAMNLSEELEAGSMKGYLAGVAEVLCLGMQEEINNFLSELRERGEKEVEEGNA